MGENLTLPGQLRFNPYKLMFLKSMSSNDPCQGLKLIIKPRENVTKPKMARILILKMTGNVFVYSRAWESPS